MFGAESEWKAWGDLHHSVRTGQTLRSRPSGGGLGAPPEDSEVFDAAMRTLSGSSVDDEVKAYDFGQHAFIADIAGGTGALLAAILRAHPGGSRGILFDQPQVVAHAAPVLEGELVAERVDVAAGDFFDNVPEGADASILRRRATRA